MLKKCFIAVFLLLMLLFQISCSRVSSEPAQKEQIGSISFEVNAKNAVAWGMDDLPKDGELFFIQEAELYYGESVIDVLMRLLPSQVMRRGGYVQGILGLGEKACGAASGWYYYVNGEAPLISAAKFYPNDGDIVRFLYTVSVGDIPY